MLVIDLIEIMWYNTIMKTKTILSENYNLIFDPQTGFTARWGKTLEDDPQMSPFGPEILDVEISTICDGVGEVCSFCYKSNTPNGKHMTLETFKGVFEKLPDTITQIAFGIGNTYGNPYMIPIFEFCRENGVIPNVTINGVISRKMVKELANVCGAVAVSNYDKDTTYNAVKALTNAGLDQVNIHQLLSAETVSTIYELFDDMQTDPRLEKLQAVVLLSLKRRGRGTSMTRVSDGEFHTLVNYALDNNVPIGFDSCTANKFINAIKFRENKETLEMYCEPCESSLFSGYVNVNGKFHPCSFTEEGEGLCVKSCNDFVEDIWFHSDTEAWRKELISNKRSCPIYNV